MLRQWGKEGSIERLELLLDKGDFPDAARFKVFRDLICMKDVNTLHLAMMIPNIVFVQALIDYYQQHLIGDVDCPIPPWKMRSKNGDTILHMALYSRLEEHALYFLSVDPTLCEISNNKGESPLFAAVYSGCEKMVEEILNIHPNPCYTMLRWNDGQTLLHLLTFCSGTIPITFIFVRV